MSKKIKKIVESTIKKKTNKIKEAKFNFQLEFDKDLKIYTFIMEMDQLIEPSMRPRTSYGRIYDPLATYKTIINKKVKDFLDKNNYEYPEKAEIECDLKLYITPNASYNKYEKLMALINTKKPTSKPDIDNCAKTIFDTLNETVYKDDAQIYKFSGEKIFDVNEKTYFKLIIKDITEKPKIKYNSSLIDTYVQDENLKKKIKDFLNKN